MTPPIRTSSWEMWSKLEDYRRRRSLGHTWKKIARDLRRSPATVIITGSQWMRQTKARQRFEEALRRIGELGLFRNFKDQFDERDLKDIQRHYTVQISHMKYHGRSTYQQIKERDIAAAFEKSTSLNPDEKAAVEGLMELGHAAIESHPTQTALDKPVGLILTSGFPDDSSKSSALSTLSDTETGTSEFILQPGSSDKSEDSDHAVSDIEMAEAANILISMSRSKT